MHSPSLNIGGSYLQLPTKNIAGLGPPSPPVPALMKYHIIIDVIEPKPGNFRRVTLASEMCHFTLVSQATDDLFSLLSPKNSV